MQNAILINALLAGTNLESANLQGANLRGANLLAANLRYSDLRGAKNLTLPQLSLALGDKTTQLPDSFPYPTAWNERTLAESLLLQLKAWA